MYDGDTIICLWKRRLLNRDNLKKQTIASLHWFVLVMRSTLPSTQATKPVSYFSLFSMQKYLWFKNSLAYINKMYPNYSSFIAKLQNATPKGRPNPPNWFICVTGWVSIFIFIGIAIIINQFAHYASFEMLICCSLCCILWDNGSSLLKASCLALIRSDVGILYTSLLLSNDHWPP